MGLQKFPHPQPDMRIPAVSYCYHGDESGESIPDGDLAIAILKQGPGPGRTKIAGYFLIIGRSYCSSCPPYGVSAAPGTTTCWRLGCLSSRAWPEQVPKPAGEVQAVAAGCSVAMTMSLSVRLLKLQTSRPLAVRPTIYIPASAPLN
jgi:hypothetical protein